MPSRPGGEALHAQVTLGSQLGRTKPGLGESARTGLGSARLQSARLCKAEGSAQGWHPGLIRYIRTTQSRLGWGGQVGGAARAPMVLVTLIGCLRTHVNRSRLGGGVPARSRRWAPAEGHSPRFWASSQVQRTQHRGQTRGARSGERGASVIRLVSGGRAVFMRRRAPRSPRCCSPARQRTPLHQCRAGARGQPARRAASAEGRESCRRGRPR